MAPVPCTWARNLSFLLSWLLPRVWTLGMVSRARLQCLGISGCLFLRALLPHLIPSLVRLTPPVLSCTQVCMGSGLFLGATSFSKSQSPNITVLGPPSSFETECQPWRGCG